MPAPPKARAAGTALGLVIDGGQNLDRLYPWLDAAAGTLRLPEAMLAGMHVALEEAVMNAVMHGSAPGAPGRVTVELRATPSAATLVVEDDGREVDPTALPARRPDRDDSKPGGLGLTLLRHFCRDISYARVGGRNQLTLRFPLA